MKKLIFILTSLVFLTLTPSLQGCSSELDCSLKPEEVSISNADDNGRFISQTRAIEIANGIVDSG